MPVMMADEARMMKLLRPSSERGMMLLREDVRELSMAAALQLTRLRVLTNDEYRRLCREKKFGVAEKWFDGREDGKRREHGLDPIYTAGARGVRNASCTS